MNEIVNAIRWSPEELAIAVVMIAMMLGMLLWSLREGPRPADE